MKNLVIVESPAKAKTIEKYLGKDYIVKSSYGHVRDLPKGDKAIDIDNGFEPKYEISSDKKQLVNELKKLSKGAETIWLATDDDREGEAISWHLHEALDLSDKETRRIVFREITKSAIQNAISSPRSIDINLVNAQQARRILDRIVGFELSPVLWKKVKGGLSAGRVQSVAVRLVVEREREIDKFNPEASFKVVALFNVEENKTLRAELPKNFKSEEEAKSFLEKCTGAEFKIKDLVKKPGKKSPAAPFTTSTLQQEASRKLGYSVSKTMIVAQKLYEAGHISYMRTDSVNLSEEAIASANREIKSNYGEKYAEPRRYKSKSASAQEAHEAIRPTNFAAQHIQGAANDEGRLYDLIWKRAVASQMAEAKIERTIADIEISTTSEAFQATGEVLVFDGFLKVYMESVDDDEAEDEKGMLPPLKIGQNLDLRNIKSTQRFSRPSARYGEASLVKKLEEMGIGRPSTYAPVISTIQKRNYVIKEPREGKERKYIELSLEKDSIKRNELTEITGTEKNKLYPTDIGIVVNDFLVKYFPSIVNYSFTAKVEEQFDQIAKGTSAWSSMLDTFYKDFHPKVEDTIQNAERATGQATRKLGVDPVTGKEVFAKLGKYGPYVQIGDNEDEEKPKYASLLKGQYLEKITLEEALELFKLPRIIGIFEDKEVTAAIGRFGPYLKHDGKFTSLGKEHDPLSVNLETAKSLILEKREKDAKKIIRVFEEDPEVKILNGRWGPYIYFKGKNVKMPKEEEAETITFEKCEELASKTVSKSKKGRKSTK